MPAWDEGKDKVSFDFYCKIDLFVTDDLGKKLKTFRRKMEMENKMENSSVGAVRKAGMMN